MNRSMVRFLLAKLLLIEAGLLSVPLAVTLIYHEGWPVFTSLLATMGILIVLGLAGSIIKPKNYRIYTKEGLLIVALCWILWSFFGALPFVFSGQIPSLLTPFLRSALALPRQEQPSYPTRPSFPTPSFFGGASPTLLAGWGCWSLP